MGFLVHRPRELCCPPSKRMVGKTYGGTMGKLFEVAHTFRPPLLGATKENASAIGNPFVGEASMVHTRLLKVGPSSKQTRK